MRPNPGDEIQSLCFFTHIERNYRRRNLLRTHVLMMCLRELSVSTAWCAVGLVRIVVLLIRTLAVVRLR